MSETLILAGAVEELKAKKCKLVQTGQAPVLVLYHEGGFHALDNRCPHMGFPLEQGDVHDGLIDCHWHHARFDLETGGTFDQFADDVRCFPVEVRNGEVWVDLSFHGNLREHHMRRLMSGLERDISLVIGKSVLSLLDEARDRKSNDSSILDPYRIGLKFGTTYRRSGWGQGLTILTCLVNMLPSLDPLDHPRALYQGLSAVASETAGSPPRFAIRPLPGAPPEFEMLKSWFRQFVEVRDSEGAERCLVTAIRAGHQPSQVAEMLFTAATDHRVDAIVPSISWPVISPLSRNMVSMISPLIINAATEKTRVGSRTIGNAISPGFHGKNWHSWAARKMASVSVSGEAT
jgi:nitrite reductase/ring-hydroxylating ferredoxin subunit